MAATLSVDGLPSHFGEDEVRTWFGTFGNVTAVRLARNAAGEATGSAKVEFSSADEAERAAGSLHGTTVDGGLLNVTVDGKASPPKASTSEGEGGHSNSSSSSNGGQQQQQGSNSNNSSSSSNAAQDGSGAPPTNDTRGYKLFFGHVPFTFQPAQVKELIAPFGEPNDVLILRRPDNQLSRGCGFVWMKDRASAISAISALNGRTTLPGCPKPLKLDWAEDREVAKQRYMEKGTWVEGNKGSINGGRPFSGQQLGGGFGGPQQRFQNQFNRQQGGFGGGNQFGGGGGFKQGFNQQGGGGFNAFGGGFGGQQQGGGGFQQGGGVGNQSQFAGQFGGGWPTAAGGGAGGFPYGMDPTAAAAAAAMAAAYAMPNPFMAMQQQQPQMGQQQFGGGGGGGGPNARGAQREGPPGANIYVRFLPQHFTEADLWANFAPFGEIVSTKVFIDKETQVSRGFGFVSFTTPASAQAAIQAMDGTVVGGRKIGVSLRTQKPQYNANANMGGGGGFGGGGGVGPMQQQQQFQGGGGGALGLGLGGGGGWGQQMGGFGGY